MRIAFYHTELSRDGPGLMLRDILKDDPQVQALVRVIQTVDPDVLVLADIDYDLTNAGLEALADRIGRYPHRFAARPNRGLRSGRDLDGDGDTGDPGDAEGYADFAGQGGMAVLSRLPIETEGIQDFSAFAWADLPGMIAPDDDLNPTRLSTTVHWDVPVQLETGRRLHLLTWHATAPVFDGPEDRNGRRNHDEAAFWNAYLDGDLAVGHPPDDYVVLGAANADLFDGESRPEALKTLLKRLHDPKPTSVGGAEAAASDGGVNRTHKGPANLDTVNWGDDPGQPGNLRVDYVLAARHLSVTDSGVFWPAPGDPMAEDVRTASRHRLVWVDIALEAQE